jgi:hypothetical protein
MSLWISKAFVKTVDTLTELSIQLFGYGLLTILPIGVILYFKESETAGLVMIPIGSVIWFIWCGCNCWMLYMKAQAVIRDEGQPTLPPV